MSLERTSWLTLFNGTKKFTYGMRFQSAPVITDGRSISGPAVPGSSQEFQSAPVITDGRSYEWDHCSNISSLFQSAPVITDGRSGFYACLAEV